jgi:hypothetical protein
MSRNRPLARHHLRAIPPVSLRTRELARLRHVLERLHSPRLQMSVIVAMTGAIGFLSSVFLLHSGVHQLWLRYPLATVIAYAGFLLLLWCWLRLKRSDVLDGIDVQWDSSSPGAGHGCSATHTPGGGNHGVIIDTAPDIDIGEAAVFLICVAALGCAVWMAYWTVLSAPTLFAELILDSALATGLYHHLSHTPDRDWVHTALRRTAARFAFVAIVSGVAGIAMHIYSPEARSIGQVIHHHKLTRPDASRWHSAGIVPDVSACTTLMGATTWMLV